MLEIPSHSGLDSSCKNGDEDCWKFRNSHFWVLLHAWQVLLLHLKIIWNKRYVRVSTSTGVCPQLLSLSFQIIINHFRFWNYLCHSNTRLGVEQDVRSNNLFPYIIHQVLFNSKGDHIIWSKLYWPGAFPLLIKVPPIKFWSKWPGSGGQPRVQPDNPRPGLATTGALCWTGCWHLAWYVSV